MSNEDLGKHVWWDRATGSFYLSEETIPEYVKKTLGIVKMCVCKEEKVQPMFKETPFLDRLNDLRLSMPRENNDPRHFSGQRPILTYLRQIGAFDPLVAPTIKEEKNE